MFFWNCLAFSMIQRMLAICYLVPLPFLKPAWTSGSSRFTFCWSLAWRILSITLLACGWVQLTMVKSNSNLHIDRSPNSKNSKYTIYLNVHRILFNSQYQGFPGDSTGKESTCNVDLNLGSIPGLRRSPRKGKGYPLQYSCLDNPMDFTVHGVAKSQTQLSDFHLYLHIWL